MKDKRSNKMDKMHIVSNPWREAIEDRTIFLLPKKRRGFQSLEGGY